jgi:hypothetical protein
VVPTHEIFQKPNKVELVYEEMATPENYRSWPGGEALGKTMKAWRVQTKKFPEIDPGLVSDPYGFADSPDAEVISSGQNSKAPDSVALGRHGNFFLWGFSAQPSDMTPAARTCFVNAVHYIHKFDGRKPVVRKAGQSREWAFVYAGYLKFLSDEQFLNRLFPEDLRKQFGKDPAKYVAYYKENLEYLHRAGNHFAVDEDVKQLGLSNRKVELLERCVALLEAGKQTDLARRVLERYTTEKFAEAGQWRAWLDANRGRLFFSDVGGYKFQINPGS